MTEREAYGLKEGGKLQSQSLALMRESLAVKEWRGRA